MGNNDFLTPKAIADRIKAKDLQKLRWYCKMCQKQCRDENRFKYHCMSESHQRQMEIFGQNPNRIVDGYSEEFERLFLEHMKRNHCFSHVAATVVYNEFIADGHHVHMNSTQWATLTEFVKYLGKTGKCKVEETPKGWFITYIDRDFGTPFNEKMKNKRIRANLVEEEKLEREVKKQRERAEQLMGAGNVVGTFDMLELLPNLLEKPETDQKIKLTLGSSSKSFVKERAGRSRFMFADNERRVKGNKDSEKAGKNCKHGGSSALDEFMREKEQERDRINRKDYWLVVGIIVRVVGKDLPDKGYYWQKGIVRKVIDKYVAEIEMLESRDILRIDQDDLETVIPQLGGLVRIINGAYRANARLLAVNRKNFTAKVQIERGIYHGRILKAIHYDDIAKIAF